MNRRDFLRHGAFGAVALAAVPSARAAATSERPAFAKNAEELPPLLTNVEIRSNPKWKGRKAASFFIDDAIWTLRDIARNRPKSIFDNPFMKVLKECHDLYGLKLQMNLFYRTDFFYGTDEFTLADVPACYRAEFQANKDWFKLGFHSLQEFPDYPWLNIDYADVKRLFDRIRGEIARFAGEGVFTTALVPHWCPMSKDGCRAMKDGGIKLMECSVGPRYRYTGDRSVLPYGHGMRIEQNRKPETAFFWRDTRNKEISSSACAYNHISAEQAKATERSFNYVYDRDSGMCFKHLFCDAPCLNLVDVPTLRNDIQALLDCEYLVFSDHEQYFYKDYLAYQADYGEKIRVMSQMMKENGFPFICIEECV